MTSKNEFIGLILESNHKGIVIPADFAFADGERAYQTISKESNQGEVVVNPMVLVAVGVLQESFGYRHFEEDTTSPFFHLLVLFDNLSHKPKKIGSCKKSTTCVVGSLSFANAQNMPPKRTSSMWSPASLRLMPFFFSDFLSFGSFQYASTFSGV